MSIGHCPMLIILLIMLYRYFTTPGDHPIQSIQSTYSLRCDIRLRRRFLNERGCDTQTTNFLISHGIILLYTENLPYLLKDSASLKLVHLYDLKVRRATDGWQELAGEDEGK